MCMLRIDILREVIKRVLCMNEADHLLQDEDETATSINGGLSEIEVGPSSIVKSEDSRTGSQVGAKQRQKFLMQFQCL